MLYISILFLFLCYKLCKLVWFQKKFNHKCIVITGGGGALGIQIAKKFKRILGTKVILLDIDDERLRMAEELVPGVVAIKCDITNYEETKKTIHTLLESYNIDTLINNAGIVSKKSLLELTPNQIVTTFAVNSVAPMYLTKLILPHMIRMRRGHIVNISSVAGLVGIARLSDYCASKFAMLGFHNSLRMELCDYKNIHSTCICPYFFRSDLFNKSKGFPWPLNYIMYVYSLEEISRLIYRDVKSVKDLVIYPKVFGWLLRIKYIFPIYIQDRFINLGSNID